MATRAATPASSRPSRRQAPADSDSSTACSSRGPVYPALSSSSAPRPSASGRPGLTREPAADVSAEVPTAGAYADRSSRSSGSQVAVAAPDPTTTTSSGGPPRGSGGPPGGSRGPTTGFRGPATNSRGPTTGSRGPTTGSRRPITDF